MTSVPRSPAPSHPASIDLLLIVNRWARARCAEAQCAARLKDFFGGEVLVRWRLTASLVRGLSLSWAAGRCPSPVQKAPATLDACRALLVDHISYGPAGGTLGWRLAADLELVRTRGIRLFN
ncbi:unnamed protein product [Pleuronectes platessa]|uniref:Uncharacterized protein n=1 Tax=Pleuronectes platessa TaxID=8262 RepID=A0A9N7UPY5_PLEPL|nr:unnamed protein product [Pleuronectes platessa]